MDTNFNHEQSLALINEMISQARNNLQKERTYSLIFWGSVVALISLINCLLINILTTPEQSFLIWLLIFPAWGVSYFIDRSIDRSALVKTHIDKIGDMVWKGFGIGVLVFVLIINVVAHLTENFQMMMLINSVIMVIVGICEFASACIYRHKPWYWVAVLFWAGALSCAFLEVDIQFIVLAVCMIFGFVVPGYMLNRKSKRSDV